MSVTRDPRDPDFPHGTPSGFYYGCTLQYPCPATPTCHETRARQQKVAKLNRHRGTNPPKSIPAGHVWEHVEEIRAAHPNIPHATIARAADVDPATIGRLGPNSRLNPETASKILAVNAEHPALSDTFKMDADLARLLVHQLQACGFPAQWITDKTGLTFSRLLHPASTQQQVTRPYYETLKAIFDQIDGRMADPATDGLTRRQITLAKLAASRAGVYPPAAYNEDGTLNLRALPDHPWAQADDRCAALLELAHALATTGNRAEAVRATGDRPGDDQRVTRVIRQLGIKFTDTVTDEISGKVSRFVYEPHEARQVNRDVFDRIETAWEAYVSNDLGPVKAALTLGLVDVDRRGTGALPKDHPEVIAWCAEQASEEELEQAPQAA